MSIEVSADTEQLYCTTLRHLIRPGVDFWPGKSCARSITLKGVCPLATRGPLDTQDRSDFWIDLLHGPRATTFVGGQHFTFENAAIREW
jgi:hypothetical protein